MENTAQTKPKKEFPKFKKDGTPVKKGGRPRKREVNTITRSERVPLSGMRDILSVKGKDPKYYYYWVADDSEGGGEIMRFKQAGFDFVQAGEVVVGDTYVFKTENVGTIIRTPSRDGRFLYLMKQPMEWHIEDQEEYYADIDDRERSLRDVASQGVEGGYGKVKISRRDEDFYD
jgi:hypothetical protein